MGNAINSCPSFVMSYARAKQIFDQTKPIRGRAVEVRPLGKRSYADQFSVRMNGNDVEFVLYNTPVITYHAPDNTDQQDQPTETRITLRSDKWLSYSTYEFIWHQLRVSAVTRSGKTLMRAGEPGTRDIKADYLLDFANEPIKLKYNGSQVVFDCPAPAVYGYRVNRKKANNVMAQFKEFADYLKGFVSLRKEEVEHPYRRTTLQVLTFTVGEYRMATRNNTEFRHGQTYLTQTPPESSKWMESASTWAAYVETTDAFVGLIKSDQPEDIKHENFYRAAVLLFTWDNFLSRFQNDDEQFTVALTSKDLLREMLYRKFAPQIMDTVKLDDGVVPNTKNAKWMGIKVRRPDIMASSES